MKCSNSKCNAELDTDAHFCDECGRPVSAHASATPPPVQPPLSAPAPQRPAPPRTDAPPVQQGKYGAEISRKNPGCLIFLIDQSTSMEEPMAGGTGRPKKQVVADALNRLLAEIIIRCGKEGGVREYFDVGVWSYGGTADIRPAFSADLLSIAEIERRKKRMEMRKRRMSDGAGGMLELEAPFAIWIEPVANGLTPMNAAFRAVVGPLRDWLGRHRDSFPPIVFNLTDGAYSDANPAPVVREIMEMGTSDGKVLVFNCHISQDAGGKIEFPNDQQAAGLQGLARELYDMSSPLPQIMYQFAQGKGYRVAPGARGYAFNADDLTLVDLLDLGTRAVQDRMERG